MTTINLHGHIAKKFGKKIKLHLGRVNDFINAIDSIKTNFRKTLKILSENGQNYDYCIDKEKNEINLIPSISGAGKIWIAIVMIVVAVVIAVLTAGTGLAALGLLFGYAGAGATAGAAFGAFLIGTLFMTGVSLLITTLMEPTLETPKQAHIAMGGGTSSTADSTRSFIFDSTSNDSVQGVPVQIGYGRFKVGSQVLAVSLKNYLTSEVFNEEVDNDNFIKLYD
jgi:predicted phage tail protein